MFTKIHHRAKDFQNYFCDYDTHQPGKNFFRLKLKNKEEKNEK